MGPMQQSTLPQKLDGFPRIKPVKKKAIYSLALAQVQPMSQRQNANASNQRVQWVSMAPLPHDITSKPIVPIHQNKRSGQTIAMYVLVMTVRKRINRRVSSFISTTQARIQSTPSVSLAHWLHPLVGTRCI